MNKKQGFSSILGIIIILIIVAGGIYWFSQNKSVAPISPTDLISVDTSDWQTYRNEKYGFELKYPKDWEISVYDPTSRDVDGPTFSIFVKNNLVPEKPTLAFSLGGPSYYNYRVKKYQLSKNQDGTISIVSEQLVPSDVFGQENIDNPARFEAKTRLDVLNRSGLWFMTFERGGQDYELQLKRILSTFKFTK